MSYLSERQIADTFEPFVKFRRELGFVPNLFKAQTALPRVIEAEAAVAGAVLLKETALRRVLKECILVTVACERDSVYCFTAHSRLLLDLGMPEAQLDRLLADYHDAELPPAEVALLDFTHKLTTRPTLVGREDLDALSSHGYSDEQILESVQVAALAMFLCCLSSGLGAIPEFEPKAIPARKGAPAGPVPAAASGRGAAGGGARGRYLSAVERDAKEFPPFAFFEDRFGFVPEIFRAQTLRPDVLEVEARAVGSVLLTGDVLTRVQKEYILIVVSAANLNTYCVAVHCEMLRGLGIPEEKSDQIALDHHLAELPASQVALLDFALKLTRRPSDFRLDDVEVLRRQGFTDEQILEAVVMTALTSFLNTLQMGLGTVPDFEPRIVFGPNPAAGGAHPRDEASVPSPETTAEDPDGSWVLRARSGDVEAFEELVRRHHRRVYRTLLGVLTSPEDAEDAVQNAFLKAFNHIGEFQGASRFSTWLTRIAINEGLQRVRRQRPMESLDVSSPEEQEEFRPRQVQAWQDDPEQVCSRQEMRQLVETELMKLPVIYRTAVILRDIEELSTHEAAEALGLHPGTLKTRLLRGRLMLREALSARFARHGGPRAHV